MNLANFGGKHMTLTIKNLTGGYSQLPVLKDINFEINDGETCRIDWFKWCG